MKRKNERETIMSYDNNYSNRIQIGIQECISIELESSELSYKELKKEALDLLKIVKGHVIRSEINELEVA